MSESLIRTIIAEHLLFASLPEADQARLCQHCRIVALSHDESLFHQGAQAHSFYILISGSMKLFRVSPDGHAKVIEVIREGESFAEALMFLAQVSYPLNAAAIGQTRVLAVPSETYKAMLLANPQSGLKLMGNMALKLHRRINEIETLTLQNTRHRLGSYLFGLAPDPAASECHITLPMAKQLIASQLGMQPETFSRLMKEMKQQGLIDVQGARINVLDLPGLREFGH